MPREIFPSSYECDCGHQSHFFENTIKEMKTVSRKKNKKQYLGDSEIEEHLVVFYLGEMIDIVCPKQTEEGRSSGDERKNRKRRKPGQ